MLAKVPDEFNEDGSTGREGEGTACEEGEEGGQKVVVVVGVDDDGFVFDREVRGGIPIVSLSLLVPL